MNAVEDERAKTTGCLSQKVLWMRNIYDYKKGNEPAVRGLLTSNRYARWS